MISQQDIQALLQHRGSNIISLYLDISPNQDFQSGLRAKLKEIDWSKPGWSETRSALALIEKRAYAPTAAGMRGRAVFAGDGALCTSFDLPQPVSNCLLINAQPYVLPLFDVLTQYHRYGVALVNEQDARVHEIFLGAIEERPETLPESPMRRPGDRRDPLQRHLSELCDRLGWLSRVRGWDRLVLGVSPKLEPILHRHLPTFLRQGVIVDTELHPGLKPDQVYARVGDCEKEARKVRESVLTQRLLDQVSGGGPAVVGLEATLAAVQAGQVRVLLVKDGFAKMGRRCAACGLLSLNDRSCGGCRGATEPVFNIVDELINVALALHCEIFRIFTDQRIEQAGRIGAELRFRTKASAAKGETKFVTQIPRSASSALVASYMRGWSTPPQAGGASTA